MPTHDTDVLVVGAGPAGLTASALLARAGVRSLTISKYDSTADSPRAHITNQRAGEIFRDLGVEDEVLAKAMSQRMMGEQVFATSFAGQELARTMAWGAGIDRCADYQRASPASICNIPQHVLEPILLKAANRNRAEIRFGHELVALRAVADGTEAVVRERHNKAQYTIRARYVIGADGGRSTVAQAMDIGFEGEGVVGESVSVWLKADLSKHVSHRSGALVFIYHPASEVLFSVWPCVSPWDEWNPFFLKHKFASIDTTEGWIRQQIEAAIGDPSIDYEIKKITKWQVNSLVAKQYRKGNVFIVGDAAHRHSPANGLGSNTSIQDSYNLVWKLALVLSGQASDRLLDTYDVERRPIGEKVIARAMQSSKDMGHFWRALDAKPGQSDAEARQNIDALFAQGDESARTRQAMWAALGVMDGQFNAHGVELGQRYASDAVVRDTSSAVTERESSDLHYAPSTTPGAHLPHVWLEKNRQRISTLDLVAYRGFTLLTGVGGGPWQKAASVVAHEFSLPIASYAIGLRLDCDDVFGDWARTRAMDDGGCLLVRPDRFILWRCATSVPEAAAIAELRRVVGQVLGRSGEARL